MARCFQLSLLLLVLLLGVVTGARTKRNQRARGGKGGKGDEDATKYGDDTHDGFGGHGDAYYMQDLEEDVEESISAKCTAHQQCRHLDGDCCPSSAGVTLGCCNAGKEDEENTTPAKGGKGGGHKYGSNHGEKYELKGRVQKTKDEGGTREKPSDQMKRFAEALDMLEDWVKAEAILKSVKNSEDAEVKAKDAMHECSKDEEKFNKASMRDKKGMLSSILRELFENLEDEVQDEAAEKGNRKKQKHMKLKHGKNDFLKFFEPSSGEAKAALKDDIDVIEPAEDAEGTNVDLGKTSIYCSMEDGEVCTVVDAENDETIRIEKQAGEFRVTRDSIVHDCGSHNKVDTTCGWDTPFGTRFLDFGSALLSGGDAVTSTDAPSKSSSVHMQLHLAVLSLLAAAGVFLGSM